MLLGPFQVSSSSLETCLGLGSDNVSFPLFSPISLCIQRFDSFATYWISFRSFHSSHLYVLMFEHCDCLVNCTEALLKKTTTRMLTLPQEIQNILYLFFALTPPWPACKPWPLMTSRRRPNNTYGRCTWSKFLEARLRSSFAPSIAPLTKISSTVWNLEINRSYWYDWTGISSMGNSFWWASQLFYHQNWSLV